MELDVIVTRYAEALSTVDATTDIVRGNRRTGEVYPESLKALTEDQAVLALDVAWEGTHPYDFSDPHVPRIGVPYPDLGGTRCDHVFNTIAGTNEPEWALEVKNIALVGNNGKLNGYPAVKMLSPFLADRSLMHDAARLRYYRLAKRHAVIGYTFRYDAKTCEMARDLHPGDSDKITEIESACQVNGGSLDPHPLLDFADSILRSRGLIKGARAEAPFTAWRHPCAGEGLVFGWEIRRPELEPGFDPRHPW